MKVFISIPMNGRSDQEVRNERDSILETIKNTTDENIELIDQMLPDTGSRVDMLGRSISMMKDADMVVFAKGWNNSPGCRVEYMVCKEYNIKITLYDMINIKYHMGRNACSCIIDDCIDNPNERAYNDQTIFTFNSIDDVDVFCKRFNHDNNYNDGITKLSCGMRIQINDGTYNKEWMIAGFDCEYDQKVVDGKSYDNGYGICLIPVKELCKYIWNNTMKYIYSDNKYGYLDSDIDRFLNSTVFINLNKVLADHIVNRYVLLGNAYNSYEWTKEYVTLMSIDQLNRAFGKHNKYDDGEANYQLPVFNYIPFKTGSYFWLRDIRGKRYPWFVSSDGSIDYSSASNSIDVRPLIYIR